MHDVIAFSVFLVCLALIWMDAIPTGVLGTIGLFFTGAASLLSIDDYVAANYHIDVGLHIGFLLCVAHLSQMVWRSNTSKLTPRRRTTDFGRLGDIELRNVSGGARDV